MHSRKQIVMLGTEYKTMGGISAVVNVYRTAGFFTHAGIRYIPTHGDGSKWRKLFLFFKACVTFLTLLIFAKVRLVHVHASSRASFWRKSLFLLVAFLFRMPTVFHLHSGAFDTFYDKCSSRQKAFVRFVLDRVSAIVVLSEERKDWINSVSSNRKVLVVKNPAHLNELVGADIREPATILCLGRLGHNKGTYVLLQAVATLAKTYPAIKLLLGGDGELAKVNEEAERLGIADKVDTLGWVGGAQKKDLLDRAAIYALPSFSEGMPVSVLEAMAAGLPIVSTPVGGIPAAVRDGLEGFLVQPGDADALAGALHKLLADGDLRNRMGATARQTIEKEYSADAILPNLTALYASTSDPVTAQA